MLFGKQKDEYEKRSVDLARQCKNLKLDIEDREYLIMEQHQRVNRKQASLKKILNEYLSEDENGQKVLYVPDVYFIKDGKIVGHHLGTVDSQADPTISLTEEEKNELLDIFNELFEKIRN